MTKEQRAQIARQNGAKSKGPKTGQSVEACREAARSAAQCRIAAVTMDCTLLPGESRQVLDAIAALELAFYQPSTPTEHQLVHELVDINWRIRRIRHSQTNDLEADMEAQRQRANAPNLSTAMAAQAEINGSMDNGPQTILDRRGKLVPEYGGIGIYPEAESIEEATMVEVISEWDYAQQKLVLPQKLHQLALLRVTAPKELASLIESYWACLHRYLVRRDQSGHAPESKRQVNVPAPLLANEAVRQLAMLNRQRMALRRQLASSAEATEARPP